MQKNTGKKNTKRVAIVGGTVAALLGGGIAFAAWTSTGTGSGSATAGSDAGLTVSHDGTATGLFPTGSKNVTVTVTNPNSYNVQMVSVAPGTTTVAGNTGTCTAASVSTSEQFPSTDVLAPHATQSYTFAFGMSNGAEDGCQRATFTIPFTATGHSTDASATVPVN